MNSSSISKILDYSSFPNEAYLEWDRFLDIYQKAKKQPFNLKQKDTSLLLPLFGNSRFLCHFLRRHPLIIDLIFSSPFLNTLKPREAFKNEIYQLKFTDMNSWLQSIRIYKYQELLRITMKDFNNQPFEDVLKELSFLALEILDSVNQKVYKQSTEQWGQPLTTSGQECAYHILAMGKLGGMELNYSSDIDLIALIESAKEQNQQMSFHDFFVRHIKALTRALQNKTEEGFLYRTDWDLRPEGKSGTLINSTTALEYYYETFGKNWERQAYTKASLATGSRELGERFLNKLIPFIYRQQLDLVNIQEIQSIKDKIHEDLGKKNKSCFNVKLGRGGIREVEFFAQAFLLIYGGRDPTIRHHNTIEVLTRLKNRGYVTHPDIHALQSGYYFLRKVEHSLQLLNESQTHDLSDLPDEQIKIARRMGYKHEHVKETLYEFRKDLIHHTTQIHQIYERLFADHAPTVIPSRFSYRPSSIPVHEYREALSQQIASKDHLEEQLSFICQFKNNETQKILELESNRFLTRRHILFKLSLLAEAICQKVLDLAFESLKPKYGIATTQQHNLEPFPSELVAIGMGKFGGFEIGYGSDLDLIFIYSDEGQTTGPEVITNSEYFSRIVQRFISILSAQTIHGRTYEIDMELRPSGTAGTLVTSLDSFMDYQKKVSQIWERQSLIRAHPMIGPAHFCRLVKEHIDSWLYSTSFSESIAQEMNRLRMRVEKEVANESSELFDFKAGRGAIMDIEFILQHHQLRYGYQHNNLRTPNTFDGLDKLIELNLIRHENDALLLKEAYSFYRTFESKLFIRKKRGVHDFSIKDPVLKDVAKDLYLDNTQELIDLYKTYRDRVREIYLRIFA